MEHPLIALKLQLAYKLFTWIKSEEINDLISCRYFTGI